MDSTFPKSHGFVRSHRFTRRTQAFLIRVEKAVHRCAFWYDIRGILTPPDRIRLKKEDMLIEGLTKGPMALWWGVEIVGGCSSAGVKV